MHFLSGRPTHCRQVDQVSEQFPPSLSCHFLVPVLSCPSLLLTAVGSPLQRPEREKKCNIDSVFKEQDPPLFYTMFNNSFTFKQYGT